MKLGLIRRLILGSEINFIQKVKLRGEGAISLGNRCELGVYPSANISSGECYLEARGKKSEIVIGNNVCINNNASIICDGSYIDIKDDTLIGPNFKCFDSNFHSLSPGGRRNKDRNVKPVNIGRNVFIGANVTILKGVTIGDNSVIASGLVINESVPANVIVKHKNNIEYVRLKNE